MLDALLLLLQLLFIAGITLAGFWLPRAVRRIAFWLYPLQASRMEVESVTNQAMLETMVLHRLEGIDGPVAPVAHGFLLPRLQPALRLDPDILSDHRRLAVLATYRRLVTARAPARAALFHVADVNTAFGDGYGHRKIRASDLTAHTRMTLMREARRTLGRHAPDLSSEPSSDSDLAGSGTA